MNNQQIQQNTSPSKGWAYIFGGMLAIIAALVVIILLALMGFLPYPFTPPSVSGAVPTVTPLPQSTPVAEVHVGSTPTPFLPYTDTPIPPTATTAPTATNTPVPTPLPPPPTEKPKIKPQAYIRGVRGYSQTFSLSCESRAAVDWAAFFGVDISEVEFQTSLPYSDNPNKGFVGDPSGYWGQIPPNAYGVYAKPVAALLRKYGLKASARNNMRWEDVRAEISSGQPVIVWVIGSVQPGHAETYTADDGEKLLVARFEHTIILIGYSGDTATVVDGALEYTVDLRRFLDSWDVLGNQAVIYKN